MRAYYFDNLPGDQRLPHDCVPSRPVSEGTLQKINVGHWHIAVEGHEEEVNIIAKERGYKNRDTINVTKEGLGEVNMVQTRWCSVLIKDSQSDVRREA